MVAAMVQNMRLHMDFKFDIPKGSAFSWKQAVLHSKQEVAQAHVHNTDKT